MGESNNLLKIILERPDEDPPRLVYADWLDEHGCPERAEFIRVQCELARTDPWTSQHRQLSNRAKDLLTAHAEAWARPLGLKPYAANFHRGFIERDCFSPGRFLELAPQIFDQTPLRQVDLMTPDVGGDVYTGRLSRKEERLRDEVVGSELLAPVRVLTLFDLGKKTVGRLAASPHLGRLEELGLYGGPAADAFASLAKRHLTGLRRLKLSVHNNPSPAQPADSGLEILSRSQLAPQLVELYMRGLNVTAAGVAHLAGTEWQSLRSLFLHDNPIDDDGVIALLHAPHSVNWTSLSLLGPGLTGRSVRAVARSTALANLHTLRIEARGWTARDLTRLIQATHLANLRELSIKGINPDSFLTTASKLPETGRLRRMILGDAHRLTDVGAKALLRSSPLDQVASIFFTGQPSRIDWKLFNKVVAKLGPRYDSY